MPVYMVYVSAGRFSPEGKGAVARAITNAHRELTGTQHFLAQVSFQEQQAGNVFLGGVQQGGDLIFVHGHHRLGRPADLKHRLAAKIVDDISKAAGVEKRHIWLYIDEMPANQMIEYGRFLPEPGQEQAWFDAISGDEKAFMRSNVFSESQEKT
jgi:phenylpyruvate tautomerase PptA (4-oxalocrotonate tautomerase family)